MKSRKTSLTVTKDRPCRHCGKTDWCYYFPDLGLEVCNRGHVAPGWIPSGKSDSNQNPYLYEDKPDKPKPKIVDTQRFLYTDREGQPLARTCRHNFDDGTKKPYRQGKKNGRWVNSCKHIPRENIPIYKYLEIRQAIADNLQVFWVEGEKCADILWGLGIPATTNFGGSGQLKDSDLADLEGANLVICPDSDEPGIKLAEKVYAAFPNAQWLYAYPDSKDWSKKTLPKSDGCDVWDWIRENKLTAENIYDAIEVYRGDFRPDDKPLMAPEAEQHYTEKAIEALYSKGHYIGFEDNLYKFTGKYYEKLSPKREQRRIADWCRSNPVSVGANRWKFAYASAATVNNIWSWLLVRFGVDPEDMNPPGLNLNNGILQTKPTKTTANAKLIPHEAKYYYTYCIEVDYDPKADDWDVNRLLECLEEGQRLILLRTLAASLNLAKVRKYKGREVKALLLTGTGNNGKDSLRELCQTLFSESMVSLSVGDFQQYDQGRKFPLSKLANSRISWSSENTKFSSLENLQSLKAAITGDTIDIEQKNQPEYQIQPETVFLFNCNEPPSLIGGSEAIKSRWSILSFTKTYKKNADPRHGEIEADPRFRYDPDFLRESVAPAFLNKIIEQLPLLLKDGIDYSPTEAAFEEIQAQSNHLWDFVQDKGIKYKPDAKLYIKDLWDDLREWYKATGTLEVFDDGYGREKAVWHDQTNPYDKTIKGPNQIYKRFLELFPKIKKMRETQVKSLAGQTYLAGIAKTASTASTSDYMGLAASTLLQSVEAVTEAVIPSQSQVEAVEADRAPWLSDDELARVMLKRFSYFSDDLKETFLRDLTEIADDTPG
ncbi:MAG: DUF5906 domain-containing protein [Crocosphaera sp.]|nr:DUF5906 domain-containing protein [Crocosphaera sp.]